MKLCGQIEVDIFSHIKITYTGVHTLVLPKLLYCTKDLNANFFKQTDFFSPFFCQSHINIFFKCVILKCRNVFE